ncbi:MAG: RNA degradosome polyphosphate kinase [Cyanobacteria bacterium]|nr:RNA degradosome polyphosphate kinase [Cyanobacteriota bacterium]
MSVKLVHTKKTNTKKTPSKTKLQKSSNLINREISWLKFNERVLEEANNPHNPLLERLRFLAIADRNLDEFYMVRVAGLKNQLELNIHHTSHDGMTPKEQLDAVNTKAKKLVAEQNKTWRKLTKELGQHGIGIVQPARLNQREKLWLKNYFSEQIFPVLTPLAVDPAHPFPFIPNDGLCFVLKVNDPEGIVHWSLIPLPRNLPRFIPIGKNGKRFLKLESVVSEFLDDLFPEFTIKDYGLFHLIRDSEMAIEEDSEDLIETFKMALQMRKQGEVIRLMVNKEISDDLLNFVVDELEIDRQDVFRVKGLLNLDDLAELILPQWAHLQFPPFTPRIHERFQAFGGNCFQAMQKSDVLLHHPYDSFRSVMDFLDQAAMDPNVLAIKQTLYRTREDSPIIKSLISAAEAGKNVTVVIELKARFDEAENIRLAEMLESAGVHVVYGFIDFKTHCKLTMVVRKEGRRIRNYLHMGTGNYNPTTAKIYTDISLFTANQELCRDASKLFNYLTGYAKPHHLEHLIISPIDMQAKLIEMIEREIELNRVTGVGRIWAKMNALVDPVIINMLYKASQAGVQIDLVVRGICCLCPGVPGLSENIRVTSIVGRFLEHSRIVCFGNGAELPSPTADVFISSADWMPRNFHSRVETLIPILNPKLKKELLEKIMSGSLRDERQSWVLQPDGNYQRLTHNKDAFSVQDYFMQPPESPDPSPSAPKPKGRKKSRLSLV